MVVCSWRLIDVVVAHHTAVPLQLAVVYHDGGLLRKGFGMRAAPQSIRWMDMVEIIAEEMVAIWPGLQNLALGFHMNGEESTTPEEARETLGAIIRFCRRLGWIDLANQSGRLLARSEDAERGEPMYVLAQDLTSAFEEKFRNLHVAIIEDRDRELYRDASQHLCGGSLAASMAVSEEELNLAGRSLALGLSTAAVAHAMRAVEASLHVLARDLGISFPAPVELQNWAVLTDKIDAVIRQWNQAPRSQQKSEQQQKLSEVMLEANGFRLAWRNHVHHAREKYEAPEARVVLEHTGRYLRKLSDTI